jgi:hypothetical protein
MKLLLLFHPVLLFLIWTGKSNAQDVFQPSARYQALAEINSPLSDGWSVFGNQAGLAGVEHPEIGGSFQNRFLISELSSVAGYLAIPVNSNVFAVSVYQFGKVPFRREKYGLAYARTVFSKLKVGFQFNYYRLFLSEDNRSAGTAGLELGLQYILNSKVVAGLHVLNPYQTGIKLYSGKFSYSSLIQLGILYQVSDSFILLSDLENDFDNQLRIKVGLEYRVLQNLCLRLGSSGKPWQFTAGFGFKLKKLSIDLASKYDQYLGSSPAVSFQYQFQ